MPVGSTYLRSGHRVTTISLIVPTSRPGGTWSLAADDGQAHTLDVATQACTDTATSPATPGPIDPGMDVVTFAELYACFDFEDLPAYDPVDHCLAAPLVIGLPDDDAVSTIDAARATVGLEPVQAALALVPRWLRRGADRGDVADPRAQRLPGDADEPHRGDLRC